MNCYKVRFKLFKRQSVYSPHSDKRSERFVQTDLKDYWIEAISDSEVYGEINRCVEKFNENSVDLKLDFVNIVGSKPGATFADLTKEDLGGDWDYRILC